jgi:hypothetical protein
MSRVGTKSRETIHGASIRAAAERATDARRKPTGSPSRHGISACSAFKVRPYVVLLDELRHEAIQSVEVAVCIANFDGNVPALDVAKVFKVLAKGLQVFRGRG